MKSENEKNTVLAEDKVVKSDVVNTMSTSTKLRILNESDKEENIITNNKIKLVRDKIINSANEVVINSSEWESLYKLFQVLQISNKDNLDDETSNIMQNICNTLGIDIAFHDDVKVIDFAEYEDVEVTCRVRPSTKISIPNDSDLVCDMCSVLDKLDREYGASITRINQTVYAELFSPNNIKLNNISKLDNYISLLVKIQYMDIEFEADIVKEIKELIEDLKTELRIYIDEKNRFYKKKFNNIENKEMCIMAGKRDGVQQKKTRVKRTKKMQDKLDKKKEYKNNDLTDRKKDIKKLTGAAKIKALKKLREEEDDDYSSKKKDKDKKKKKKDKDKKKKKKDNDSTECEFSNGKYIDVKKKDIKKIVSILSDDFEDEIKDYDKNLYKDFKVLEEQIEEDEISNILVLALFFTIYNNVDDVSDKVKAKMKVLIVGEDNDEDSNESRKTKKNKKNKEETKMIKKNKGKGIKGIVKVLNGLVKNFEDELEEADVLTAVEAVIEKYDDDDIKEKDVIKLVNKMKKQDDLKEEDSDIEDAIDAIVKMSKKLKDKKDDDDDDESDINFKKVGKLIKNMISENKAALKDAKILKTAKEIVEDIKEDDDINVKAINKFLKKAKKDDDVSDDCKSELKKLKKLMDVSDDDDDDDRKDKKKKKKDKKKSKKVDWDEVDSDDVTTKVKKKIKATIKESDLDKKDQKKALKLLNEEEYEDMFDKVDEDDTSAAKALTKIFRGLARIGSSDGYKLGNKFFIEDGVEVEVSFGIENVLDIFDEDNVIDITSKVLRVNYEPNSIIEDELDVPVVTFELKGTEGSSRIEGLR